MMKRKILAVLAASALMLCTLPLGAEEPLTLEQARGSALASSRTLRKALLSVDSALLTEKIQGYAALPSISASAGISASYPAPSLTDSLGASVGLSVSQTLYQGGRNSLLSAIDAIVTRAAREQARAEYFSVVQSVDSAFYGVLDARSSVEAAQSDLQAARTHLELAGARLEAGIITRNAYLQSEAESAAKQTALVQAQGRLSAAESRLASLTGLSLPRAQGELAGPDFGSLEELMQRLAGLGGDAAGALVQALTTAASANNPSLSEARLASQKAKLAADLVAADNRPSVSASYRHTFSVRAGAQLEAGFGSVTLAASIPLDLWTTRANVEVKKTSAEQAELDGEEALRNLELDIQGAAYDCIASARAAISSKKALEYAEGFYQGVVELYRLGSASSGDLSDAQALVSANRTALITARYSLLSNLSGLRTLAGLETDERLISLIP